MAELPLKVHLTTHPIFLKIRGHSVYEDKKQRMWLQPVMETGGDLQVRLRQEDIPSGHITLTNIPLNLSTLPLIWMLHPGSQYVDSMCWLWHIVQHSKEDGVEEMILELKDDS